MESSPAMGSQDSHGPCITLSQLQDLVDSHPLPHDAEAAMKALIGSSGSIGAKRSHESEFQEGAKLLLIELAPDGTLDVFVGAVVNATQSGFEFTARCVRRGDDGKVRAFHHPHDIFNWNGGVLSEDCLMGYSAYYLGCIRAYNSPANAELVRVTEQQIQEAERAEAAGELEPPLVGVPTGPSQTGMSKRCKVAEPEVLSQGVVAPPPVAQPPDAWGNDKQAKDAQAWLETHPLPPDAHPTYKRRTANPVLVIEGYRFEADKWLELPSGWAQHLSFGPKKPRPDHSYHKTTPGGGKRTLKAWKQVLLELKNPGAGPV